MQGLQVCRIARGHAGDAMGLRLEPVGLPVKACPFHCGFGAQTTWGVLPEGGDAWDSPDTARGISLEGKAQVSNLRAVITRKLANQRNCYLLAVKSYCPAGHFHEQGLYAFRHFGQIWGLPASGHEKSWRKESGRKQGS